MPRPSTAAPLLSLLLLSAITHAQQLPPAAPPAPEPFFRLSITSLDAASKFAADLGLPLPPLKPRLESTFPFLGPDSVAPNRPIGALFVASDQIKDLQKAVLFAIPLSNGNATTQAIASAGAAPNPALPDTFTMGTLNLLCTPTYLVAETDETAGLPLFTDALLTRDVDSPGTIAALSLALTAYRKGAPVAYRAAIDNMKHNAQALNTQGDPVKAAGERYGEELVYSLLDKLQTFTLALATDNDALHLKLHISPALPAAAAAAPVPRPAFPPGVLFQCHVVYPNADWAHWFRGFIDGLPLDGQPKYTPAQFTRAKEIFKRVADVFIGGSAVSFAVTQTEGKPVIYLVSQHPAEGNLEATMRKLDDDAEALRKETGEKSTAATSTYDVDGTSVHRITLTGKDAPMYIDLILKDNTLAATFSPSDGHFVPALAALPANGTTAALCSGTADVAALLKAFGENNPALAALPPTLRQDLTAAVAGQAITWTAQPDSKTGALLTDVQVPLPLVKQLAKLASAALSPPPAAP